MSTKYEKILRDKQHELVVAQSALSRMESSLRIMEQVFHDAKALNRSTWFCNIKRRAANNARNAYQEWQVLWGAKLQKEAEIAQLEVEVKHYENELAKAEEYNERRRKRRAEKKQVRQ